MEKIEIGKKDWEELKKAAEAQLKSALISTIQFQTLLELCDKELSKFPDPATEAEKEIEDASN